MTKTRVSTASRLPSTQSNWMTNIRSPQGPGSHDALVLEAPWRAMVVGSGTLRVGAS